MPQDEHNEWPSFETVLRDVATSEPSPRGDSGVPVIESGVSSTTESSTEGPSGVHNAVEKDASEAQVSAQVEEQAFDEDTLDSFSSDLLPDPLPPIDIDTSAVRALLLTPSDSSIEDFELEALEPVEAASIEPVDLEPAPAFEPADFESTPAFEPADFGATPTFDSDEQTEPPSVFDLAFDPDAHTETAAFEGVDALYSPEVAGIELPTPDPAPVEVFDDLNVGSEISLDDVPQFSADELLSGDDSDQSTEIGEIPSGAVFELDESTIEASNDSDEPASGFTTPSIDLFDLSESSEEIEHAGGEFDSIATANAIEGELNELSDLTALESDDLATDEEPSVELFSMDNVIPIRPDASDDAGSDNDGPSSDWLNPHEGAATPLSHALDGPPPARVSQTGWVGLENVQPEPAEEPEEVKVNDPWAHMRPNEEPRSEGLLAKIFGGEERKRAKARRRAQEQGEPESNTEEADAELVFDPTCPNCGGECQVDLDDPIGRRVHVSCPSCDHMWFTPYIESQAG